jgi:RNA polymerase sigma-70 factor (ECF subfamily)
MEEYLDSGDLRAAAEACIDAYGAEVLGFLVRALQNEHEASEAFSQACEDLWRDLARFERQCSLRTWFYTLARHAACRLRRSPARDARRHVGDSVLGEVATCARSETLSYLRTPFKDRFAELREALTEEDRTLLILRVDRGMSWREVALVSSGSECSMADVARAEVRLRKRFQLLKTEIRERARLLGLAGEELTKPR